MEEVTVEAWNRVFAVNVLGVFLVARAAVPMLRESPDGCIVNTSSIAGLRPSSLGRLFHMQQATAALGNLMKTLPNALGLEVRVNAVAPVGSKGIG